MRPKAIGPAMAVALLTTLYGAFLQTSSLTYKNKLEGYTTYELNYRALVVEGLRQIARMSLLAIFGCSCLSLPVKQREA